MGNTQFRHTELGFCAPKCRLAPRILDVGGDGNCRFRAFFASLRGDVNFEAFHKPLRGIAARNLRSRGPAKGGRLAVGRPWAGTDAVQILGGTFGVRASPYQGSTAGSYCVVGQLESLREVIFVLPRGHWYGVRGSIPPHRGATPLRSSTHPTRCGSRGAAHSGDNAEDSPGARPGGSSVMPSATSRV